MKRSIKDILEGIYYQSAPVYQQLVGKNWPDCGNIKENEPDLAESLEMKETTDGKPAYIVLEAEAADSPSREKYLFDIIEVQEENK